MLSFIFKNVLLNFILLPFNFENEHFHNTQIEKDTIVKRDSTSGLPLIITTSPWFDYVLPNENKSNDVLILKMKEVPEKKRIKSIKKFKTKK
jgi:hypothetical protein